jgi:prohibitin 2
MPAANTASGNPRALIAQRKSNALAAACTALSSVRMNPRTLSSLIGVGVLIFVAAILGSSATYVVQPGMRGVMVTLGKVSPAFLDEGFGFKAPFIATVVPIQIRQQTANLDTDCYSSDLQQVTVNLRVLYRIPEASAVQIFQQYAGDPFLSLIAPRVSEAIKEVTALQSAEQIVKNREMIKNRSLEAARLKVGSILEVVDVVLVDISLSRELENAIEQKMVQEQEAAKSRFVQQRSQIEAETAIIRAKGEAEAIRIRGDALKDNPSLIQLQIVEKWNGITPVVLSTGGEPTGANILLPLGNLQRAAAAP